MNGADSICLSFDRSTDQKQHFKFKIDDDYEYRHVILPKALVKYLPTDRLAEEDEWRGLGIRQRFVFSLFFSLNDLLIWFGCLSCFSPGWEHYLRHGTYQSMPGAQPTIH
jgi:hypothetical protein